MERVQYLIEYLNCFIISDNIWKTDLTNLRCWQYQDPFKTNQMLPSARMKEITHDMSRAKASSCWHCTPRRSINIVAEERINRWRHGTEPLPLHMSDGARSLSFSRIPLTFASPCYLPSECTFLGTLLHTSTCVFVRRVFPRRWVFSLAPPSRILPLSAKQLGSHL